MISKTLIDKVSYGPGPWLTEPDLIYWHNHNLHCIVVRHGTMGNLNGYVGVDEAHPFHKIAYEHLEDIEDICVHGGLTFSGHMSSETYLLGDISTDIWFVGFDCAHSGDETPATAALFKTYNLPTFGSRYSTYKDIHYVAREVGILAEQILNFKQKETK